MPRKSISTQIGKLLEIAKCEDAWFLTPVDKALDNDYAAFLQTMKRQSKEIWYYYQSGQVTRLLSWNVLLKIPNHSECP